MFERTDDDSELNHIFYDRKLVHGAFKNDRGPSRVRFDDEATETYEQHEVRRRDYQDMRADHTIKNYHHHFEVVYK